MALLTPLIPLVILLTGFAVLLFGAVPRFRFTSVIAVASTGAALLALLLLAFRLPVQTVLSQWGPPSLLPRALILEASWLPWLFALGVLIVVLAALLTGIARPGGRRIAVRGAILLLTFAGVAAVLADNLITRVMAWAGLDLVYFLTLIVLARSDGLEPQSVLHLSFNSIGTLLALAAALLITRESAALSLQDAALTPQSTLLITLAAVFRLGLFPLHLGMPAEANIRQGLGTILRLVPAAVALEVLSKLTFFGIAEPARPWLSLFALAAALTGAVQLWSADDPRMGLTYVVIAQSGLALLAGLWGGEGAALALTAMSLALLLGGGLLYLGHGHDEQDRRWTLLSLLGVGTLLGMPLTIGFVGWQALYGGLAAGGHWLTLAGVLLAHALFAAGLIRAALWPGVPVTGDALVRAAYVAGLALLAVSAVGLAWVATAGQPAGALDAFRLGPFGLAGPRTFIGLGFTAAAAAAGYALWRYEELARDRAESLGSVLIALARLDWLYRLVWGVVRGLGVLVHNLAEVLEGEGAILWTLVAALLVLLLFR